MTTYNDMPPPKPLPFGWWKKSVTLLTGDYRLIVYGECEDYTDALKSADRRLGRRFRNNASARKYA